MRKILLECHTEILPLHHTSRVDTRSEILCEVLSTSMKTNFLILPIGPLLSLLKPISSNIGASYPKASKQQILRYSYKRFFRLRHLVLDAPYQQELYSSLLKRRFKFVDFDKRRKSVLDSDCHLTDEDIFERLKNTYAFLFNATCNVSDRPSEVMKYEDLKEAQTARVETRILSTIIEMEQQYTQELKYDFNYKWMENAKKIEATISKTKIEPKKAKKIPTQDLLLIGFADYERSIMSLNESFNLCL